MVNPICRGDIFFFLAVRTARATCTVDGFVEFTALPFLSVWEPSAATQAQIVRIDTILIVTYLGMEFKFYLTNAQRVFTTNQ